MRYEGQIYRPPGEWRSYLLQCTVGCSHNKCTFCGMYKTKKFHVRPMKEIIEDIAMAREYYGPNNVDKVFLCDGDAIVMRQELICGVSASAAGHGLCRHPKHHDQDPGAVERIA